MQELPKNIKFSWKKFFIGFAKEILELGLATTWFLIIIINLPNDQQTKLSEILNAPVSFLMALVWISLLLLCGGLAALTISVLSFGIRVIKLFIEYKSKQ